jgi:hypothetical protein
VADRLHHVPRLDLADDPAAAASIEALLKTAFTVPPKLRKAIAAASEGSFVYAELAAQSDTLAAGSLPVGLNSLYRQILANLYPFATDVLALLCTGRDAGFTAADVAAILGATPRRVKAAIAKCRTVLTGDTFVLPHHRCLRDFAPAVPASPTTWYPSGSAAMRVSSPILRESVAAPGRCAAEWSAGPNAPPGKSARRRCIRRSPTCPQRPP